MYHSRIGGIEITSIILKFIMQIYSFLSLNRSFQSKNMIKNPIYTLIRDNALGNSTIDRDILAGNKGTEE